MTRDWQSEAVVVTDALVARGHAQWLGVGRFRVTDRTARTLEAQTRQLRATVVRRVRFEAEPQFLESLDGGFDVAGFGRFELERLQAWEFSDPRTGERRRTEERSRVLFRPAPELETRLAAVTLAAQDQPDAG